MTILNDVVNKFKTNVWAPIAMCEDFLMALCDVRTTVEFNLWYKYSIHCTTDYPRNRVAWHPSITSVIVDTYVCTVDWTCIHVRYLDVRQCVVKETQYCVNRKTNRNHDNVVAPHVFASNHRSTDQTQLTYNPRYRVIGKRNPIRPITMYNVHCNNYIEKHMYVGTWTTDNLPADNREYTVPTIMCITDKNWRFFWGFTTSPRNIVWSVLPYPR